ncbi:MAG TPA: glycosyltransferase [Gemmatimonadaceae bacterium]|nr:glycosyltransferase [Gemmatimonadaceae bacterium]
MRVVFLAHSFPRYAGDAAGSFLLRLAVALRDQGVEVRALAPGAPGVAQDDELEGIPVRRFRYAPRAWERLAYTGTMAADVAASPTAKIALGGFLASSLWSTLALTRRWRPELLHAHWWFPGGVVARWASRLSGTPLVTTVHGTDVRLARSSRAARALLRPVLGRSRAVTAVSSWLASELHGIAPESTPHVSPMPVDTLAFTPEPVVPRQRLLYVGRLTRQKGVRTLVQALAIARPALELDVIGAGPEEAPLRALAEELGVGPRVRWHRPMPQPELAAWYRGAAAVVIPSVDEGLGLVAAEALLCGAPVVASRSGGLPDVVRDGETGLLVPPGDAQALAAAITALLARPDRGAALACAGREHVLRTFSPAAAAARYAALYHSVLS